MMSPLAEPLIKQFEAISGIDTIIAIPPLGNTNITFKIALPRQIASAAADIQAATANKTFAASPVSSLALAGDGTPLTATDDIAKICNITCPFCYYRGCTGSCL